MTETDFGQIVALLAFATALYTLVCAVVGAGVLVGHAPINWSWSNCHPRLVNERHGVGSNRDGLLRINST